MANSQNLIPGGYALSVAEASKGGKASGRVRKYKGDLRRACEALLKGAYEIDGKELSGAEAAALALMKEALSGNTRAFEVLRDTSGQKPVDKIEQRVTSKTIDLSGLTDEQIRAMLDKEL